MITRTDFSPELLCRDSLPTRATADPMFVEPHLLTAVGSRIPTRGGVNRRFKN
jgi:hypothetical protein